MFYHNINPTLLKIGPFEIRYYGIIFVLGFIIAYYMLLYLGRKREINLSKDDVETFILYQMIGVIAGARLFAVFVYNPGFYLANPLEIFAIWHGGLSFHGGLIGGVVAGLIFCRKKNIGFYKLADIIVIPAAIALCLGRIANFINGELVGRITDVPWAVKFKGYEGFRHPSQIYESLKNLFIFGVLWKIKDKKLPDGFLFWSFVLMYSVLRFSIGFFRAPDPQFGFVAFGLTMGQILNIIMFLVGVGFILRLKKKDINTSPDSPE